MSIKERKIIISIISHISLFGVLTYLGMFLVWGRVLTMEGAVAFSFMISLISFILSNNKLVNESEQDVEEREIQKKEERGFFGTLFIYLIWYPILLLFIFFGTFMITMVLTKFGFY